MHLMLRVGSMWTCRVLWSVLHGPDPWTTWQNSAVHPFAIVPHAWSVLYPHAIVAHAAMYSAAMWMHLGSCVSW